MNISAKDVKDLREKTGLGMMECKKALEEAGGDSDQAITNLRKNSALKAEKKSSRTAVEGVILSDTTDSSNSILIEINCETDFVAKDANFSAFTEEVLGTCLNSPDASLEKLLSDSLEEKRQNLVQKIADLNHVWPKYEPNNMNECKGHAEILWQMLRENKKWKKIYL